MRLISGLHATSELQIDKDRSILTNKGVPQGGVLSPHLFNIYMEHALMKNETLKKLIQKEQLVCFADDVLITSNSKEEASQAIKAFDSLKSFGLELNKNKSKIMEGPKELKEMTEFEGIQITKKVKYLGCNLTATRQAIYHETRK